MMPMNDMSQGEGGHPKLPIDQQPTKNSGYQPIPQQAPYGSPEQQGQPGQQPNYGPPGQQPYYGQPGQQPFYGQQPPYGQPGQQPFYGPPGSMPPVPPGFQEMQAQKWMAPPTGVANCPPGLEYLSAIDQLLVKQKLEVLELVTGFETNNKYEVKNSIGQNIYFAVEDNDCCTRACCGANRPFDMKIFDNYRNEVIHLYRPLRCAGCCCPCCLQIIEVSAPPGNLLGTIEQEWTICKPNFSVKNQSGDTVLRIEGPFCTMSCGSDVEFEVLSLTGEKVGKISKQWRGFAHEMYTDADNFGITFPMDLDVQMKTVLLGATFLIDMMFFENGGGRR